MNDKKKGIILMICIAAAFILGLFFIFFFMQPDDMLRDDDRKISTEIPDEEDTEGEWESDEGAENVEQSATCIPNHVSFLNEDVLHENFPKEKIEELKEHFIGYINESRFEGIGGVSVFPETVYYDGKDKFGMVIDLNDAVCTYISIDYDGSRDDPYVIRPDDYTEPPELLTEDVVYARKKQQGYETENDKEIMKELSEAVSDYYSYISSRDFYGGYEKYKDVADFYYENVPQFKYEYSTYKAHSLWLLEEMAGGSSNLLNNGVIDAKVLGYMDVENTDYYIAKVKLTLSAGKESTETVKWITVFSYMEGDLIFPEDNLLLDTWVYAYRY